jgi:hypothetical protein
MTQIEMGTEPLMAVSEDMSLWDDVSSEMKNRKKIDG